MIRGRTTELRLNEIVLSEETLREFEDRIREIFHHELSILNKTQEKDEYLSTKQASKILNVSRVTLLKWEKKNLLVPYRPNGTGRAWYTRKLIDNYIKRGSKGHEK